MLHPSFITLPYRIERQAPEFAGAGLQSPESLIRYCLKTYTGKGDSVFDPFAGLGTSLFVAEEMGRVPYGIEADQGRREWVAGQLKHWTNLLHADSASMHHLNFPKMDFCITCPPFMRKNEQWNPLYNGLPAKAGYAIYLKRMKFIFSLMKLVMKRNAYVIVQVDNLHGKVFTPLVSDIGEAIRSSLKQEGEMIAAFEGGVKDYRHTHCLIFRNA